MLREQIRSSPEYQQVAAQQDKQGQQAQQSPPGSVIELEKGDIEFWTEIAQLVVLLLILREVRQGGI